VGGAPAHRQSAARKRRFAGRAESGSSGKPISDLDVYLKYETSTRNGDGYVGKSYSELAGASNGVDARLAKPFVVSYDIPSWDKYTLWRVTNEINWNVSENVSVRSLSGYQYTENRNQWDDDFNLCSHFERNSAFPRYHLRAGVRPAVERERATSAGFSVHSIFATNTPTYLNLTIPPTILINTGPREHSYAVFGQGTYKFTDKMAVAAGAAASIMTKKTSTGSQQLVGFPVPTRVACRVHQDNRPYRQDCFELLSRRRTRPCTFSAVQRLQAPGGAKPQQQRELHFPP